MHFNEMIKFIYEKFRLIRLKLLLPWQIFNNLKNDLSGENNISLSESVKRTWQLLYDYKLLYNNIEEYVQGQKPSIGRIIKVTTIEIFLLIVSARTLTMAFYDKPIIQIITNDFIEQMGNKKSSLVGAMLMAPIPILALLCLIGLHYHELKQKLKFFNCVYDLIQNKPTIQLSYSRHRRLTLGLHLITKYIFPVIFNLSLISVLALYTHCSFLYSPDRGSFLSIIMGILWIAPNYFTLKAAFIITYLGSISYIFCMFYVKYTFNTIEDNIKLCVEFRNSQLVIKAIEEHRIATKLCEDMNDFFKVLNFFLYFIVSPFHVLYIYFMFDVNTLYIQVGSALVVISGYSANFSVILMGSLITRSAHRPRKYLYKYLNRNSLRFKHRMKIMFFNEKLSGHNIGFYCLDFFPMKTFEFYKYIAFCVSFYIMISNFFH